MGTVGAGCCGLALTVGGGLGMGGKAVWQPTSKDTINKKTPDLNIDKKPKNCCSTKCTRIFTFGLDVLL